MACGSQTTSATITVSCTSGLTVTYDDVLHCAGNTSTLSGSVSDPGESYTYTFNGADSYMEMDGTVGLLILLWMV